MLSVRRDMAARLAGFTLIELLVAVLLAAMIAALGSTLLGTALRTNERVRHSTAQHQAVRDAYRLIESYWSRKTSQGFVVRSGNPSFVISARPGEAPHVRIECIATLGADRTDALVLHRTSAGQSDASSSETDPPGELLVAELESCVFAYLRPPPAAGMPAIWVPEWPNSAPPPTAIRLDLATPRGSLPPLIFSSDMP